MAVKFRKQAIKFLQKANPEEVDKLQTQIQQLLIAVEEQGIIPLNLLDIKNLNRINLIMEN
jgi:mRNA interferase RelE/StbE